MVFTHIPSSLLLIALGPTIATALWTATSAVVPFVSGALETADRSVR